ncbi:ABC transporter substrate-binding protein [Streptomyces sp. SID8379]|uniref:peptide ABC transporter substrate-binding protein n=1 Tax=unclassified Streptomyces TaxID=2593676 RepID=UPI0007C53954|nr:MULTISPECIES: ABC transporter substrate-binding protein [unclassified Streptomyces]MYW66885.1 ABC transporter substrate-binding protein [Streptomyces sp. SID8379]
MARTRRGAAVAAVAALGLTAVGCGGGSDDKGDGAAGRTLTVATGTEIAAINPEKDNSSSNIQLAFAMWAPLTRVDQKSGKLVNVVADSVTSKDAKTWTIRIKPGWTFTNGEKLTAKSFVDTWNYTAYGPHGYLNNGFFQKVQGYEDLNPAEGKPKATTLSGLKVVDDLTFTVTLKAPFSPYPTTLSYYGLAALSQEALKDPDQFSHRPIGYGPYKLDGAWKAGRPVRMVRNKDYAGDDAPDADRLVYRFFSNPETAYNEFLAGNLDYAALPSSKIDSYKTDAPGKWSQGKAAPNLSYLELPVNTAGFKDPKVRRALSLALDRESLAKLKPGAVPATSFTAPTLDGHRDHTCTACTFDVTQAKKLLREAGGFRGKLKIYYASDNPGDQVFAEALGNMWRQNLGLRISYVGKPGSDISALQAKHQLDGVRSSGWGHDYPSLEDYLSPVFASHGDFNSAGYRNPEVDRRLAKANAIADPAKATRAYQEIEDLIAEDMPTVPLFHTRTIYLHSADVHPLDSRYADINPVRSTIDD